MYICPVVEMKQYKKKKTIRNFKTIAYVVAAGLVGYSLGSIMTFAEVEKIMKKSFESRDVMEAVAKEIAARVKAN